MKSSLSTSAAKRVAEIRQMEGNDELMLRLAVLGGGVPVFSTSSILTQTPTTMTTCSKPMARNWSSMTSPLVFGRGGRRFQDRPWWFVLSG